MGFSVEQPPKDDTALAAKGKEIVEAAKALGLNLDTEGFLLAWLNGTRVLVERDASNEIIGFALVAIGHRWLHNDFTASVLDIRGPNREGMLAFLTTIANALGATDIFIEDVEPIEVTAGFTRYSVRKIHLQ